MPIKYRAVYDSKGKAYEIEDGRVTWSRPDLSSVKATGKAGYTLMPDLPAFVSPIDGTVVDGRRQFRDHCRKHDVVPTSDLKGLPMKTIAPQPSSREHREGTKRAIADVINQKY